MSTSRLLFPKVGLPKDHTKLGGVFIVDPKARFRDSDAGHSLNIPSSPHVAKAGALWSNAGKRVWRTSSICLKEPQ